MHFFIFFSRDGLRPPLFVWHVPYLGVILFILCCVLVLKGLLGLTYPYSFNFLNLLISIDCRYLLLRSIFGHHCAKRRYDKSASALFNNLNILNCLREGKEMCGSPLNFLSLGSTYVHRYCINKSFFFYYK